MHTWTDVTNVTGRRLRCFRMRKWLLIRMDVPRLKAYVVRRSARACLGLVQGLTRRGMGDAELRYA